MRDDPITLTTDEAYMLAVYSLRYSIGRRTYASQDVTRFVTRILPWLTEGMRTVLARDIRDHVRQGYSLGDECDRVLWVKLLDDLNEGLTEKMVLPVREDDEWGSQGPPYIGWEDEGCPKKEE